MLAEDLAKPLREKMGSVQYTEVLLRRCFMETVDATKVHVARMAFIIIGWTCPDP